MPVVDATAETLLGYGRLVDDPADVPDRDRALAGAGLAAGRHGHGRQGGTTEGVFVSEWQRRHAVRPQRGGRRALHPRLRAASPKRRAIDRTVGTPSACCSGTRTTTPTAASCSFRSIARRSCVPLALPGDDVKPQDFVCFRFDGRQGLYIHPNVWHEGVFGVRGTQRFFDKQGAVHARVSRRLRARVRLPARSAGLARTFRICCRPRPDPCRR